MYECQKCRRVFKDREDKSNGWTLECCGEHSMEVSKLVPLKDEWGRPIVEETTYREL